MKQSKSNGFMLQPYAFRNLEYYIEKASCRQGLAPVQKMPADDSIL